MSIFRESSEIPAQGFGRLGWVSAALGSDWIGVVGPRQGAPFPGPFPYRKASSGSFETGIQDLQSQTLTARGDPPQGAYPPRQSDLSTGTEQ